MVNLKEGWEGTFCCLIHTKNRSSLDFQALHRVSDKQRYRRYFLTVSTSTRCNKLRHSICRNTHIRYQSAMSRYTTKPTPMCTVGLSTLIADRILINSFCVEVATTIDPHDVDQNLYASILDRLRMTDKKFSPAATKRGKKQHDTLQLQPETDQNVARILRYKILPFFLSEYIFRRKNNIRFKNGKTRMAIINVAYSLYDDTQTLRTPSQKQCSLNFIDACRYA